MTVESRLRRRHEHALPAQTILQALQLALRVERSASTRLTRFTQDNDLKDVLRLLGTMSEPFRFLDLPKELRLMVYDFLPIRTTPVDLEVEKNGNRRLVLEPLRDEERNLWKAEAGRELPKVFVAIVSQSIPGLAILRTCRIVTSEAGVMMKPKLVAIRESPISFSVNSIALKSRGLYYVLSRLARSLNGAPKYVNMKPQLGHITTASLQIIITINDSFADRTPAGLWMSPREMVSLKFAMLGALQLRLETLYSLVDSYSMKPRRDLRVKFRMVLLSEEEKAAFEKENVWASTERVTQGVFSLRMSVHGELKVPE